MSPKSADKVEVVLPGEQVLQVADPDTRIKIGPGLRINTAPAASGDDAASAEVVACKAGVLRRVTDTELYVDNVQRRYVPQLHEPVIGVVTGKTVEGYRVDIGCAHPAMLGALAFEGASKRNRPNLEVGSVVFARVSLADKDMEPELECFNHASGKAEGYGELKGGYTFQCSLSLSRSLLKRENPFLQQLGAQFPFEVAAGANGRVWVNSSHPRNVVTIVRTLKASEGVAASRAKDLVRAQRKRIEDAVA
ncbi:exosome non-catalytic core subunit rrp40 [Cladochytrium tenue]|nr:exosome non-catalytic core subunit rrp40 [Cladochytrium tenue]